jgi:serine/threonine-protein kinase
MANEARLGTVDWLAAELTRGHLVERARLAPLVAEFRALSPEGDSLGFAEFLVGRAALTPYQIEKVMDGELEALGVGPYVLAEPVGAGGLGIVYRAYGRADRQPYAIKLVVPRGESNLRLVRRQVRSFAELPPHPALVPCVDVGTCGDRHYVAWPFVTGEPLEVFIARHGPLAAPDAVRLALDLADALHLAHGHGLFHGVVKPSNVLVGDDGVARLLDFGVGALLAGDELFAADDQFGLGLVLFFALTGHLTSDEDLPEGIPLELVDVVARLLADAPAERYRDFGEVVRELRPHLDVMAAFDGAGRLTLGDELADTPQNLPRTAFAPPMDLPPLTPLTSAAPAEVEPESLLKRALGKLTFWRPPRDAVAVSVLAPPTLPPGEPATLALFAHGAAREIRALGRTYFPGHGLAGSVALRRPVARGERLTAHLALPGLAVEPAVQKFVWAGQTLPLPCSVHVPADFRPGEIVGVLSLARGADVIMNHEFRVVVSGEW